MGHWWMKIIISLVDTHLKNMKGTSINWTYFVFSAENQNGAIIIDCTLTVPFWFSTDDVLMLIMFVFIPAA